MNDPRRHHFVPQVYLRNFTVQEGKPGKIYVYDHIKKIKYKTDITKVAVENDFYRLPGKEDEFYWERFYSTEVEPLYGKIIKELNTLCTLGRNGSEILNQQLKDELSYIVCSQFLRTQKSRIRQQRIGKKAASERLEELKKEFFDLMSPEQKALINGFEIEDDFIKEKELEAINDPERIELYMKHLNNRSWIIYYNKNADKVPFITSDHPVSLFNFTNRSTSFSDNGLGLNTTIIFFPLSTKILIGLYPRQLFLGLLHNLNDCLNIVDEPKFIHNMNDIQFIQSYRQVYSSIEFLSEK